jgi:hypothetical protein
VVVGEAVVGATVVVLAEEVTGFGAQDRVPLTGLIRVQVSD